MSEKHPPRLPPIDYRMYEPRTARAIARHNKVPKEWWPALGIPPAPRFEGWYERIIVTLVILCGIAIVMLFFTLLGYHYCDRWGLPLPGFEWTGMCAVGHLR